MTLRPASKTRRRCNGLARIVLPYAIGFLIGFVVCLSTMGDNPSNNMGIVVEGIDLIHEPQYDARTLDRLVLDPLLERVKDDGIFDHEKLNEFEQIKKKKTSSTNRKDAKWLSETKFDSVQPVVLMAGHLLRRRDTMSSHRIHIATVLKRIGYRFAANDTEDWDLFYASSNDLHEHAMERFGGKIKPHQKVNFMPGHKIVTSKDILMAMNLPNMPRAFQIPKDNAQYLEYRKLHPEKEWLLKERKHRRKGVRYARESDVNMTTPAIFQELIPPLLIENRKFDFAVYVMILSKDPLRVYVETGEWLLRYCIEDYHPFDPYNLNKYVASAAGNVNTWDMKVVKDYFDEYHMTAKESMLAYLKSRGHRTEHIERTVMDIIWNVYVAAEPLMLDAAKKYEGLGDNRNFFELTRFDMIMDENSNVFLVEVNAGPAMSSNERPRRKPQLERTIYGYMALTGIASYTRKSMRKSDVDAQNMRVWKRDLTVFNDECLQFDCHKNCSNSDICMHCGPCLSEYDQEILQQSYLEHMNRYGWQRVIPWPLETQQDARKWVPEQDRKFKRLSKSNRKMSMWFWGKCLQNYEWCT